VSRSSHLEIVALGGLGEFGMNLMLYRHGDDCIVVDAGIMFPRQEHLGVEVIVPEMSFLESCGTLHGVILTHGHEDHIGAVPYLLARHDVPVFSTEYTRELVRARLSQHDGVRDPRLKLLPPDGQTRTFGPFAVETLPAAHSIPRAKMLALHTPAGVVVHTADFKLDPVPAAGAGTDLGRLAQLGRDGVLALMSDSTNADRPGFTGSEASVRPGIEELVAACPNRVVVTTFASNVQRLQTLARIAAGQRRKIAFVGSSIEFHAEVAQRLGLLELPRGLRVSVERAMQLPRREVLLAVTGSQGEPLSALARISVGKHGEVELDPGDLVIHSARVIPGNENSIGRMIDHLLRRGAEVVTSSPRRRVHVSGHPSQDELRLLLQLVRPRHLVPIHGDYRQLHAHARLGVDAGLDRSNVLLAESGDLIRIHDGGIQITERVHVGQVFIDATLDQVDLDVLRDRRRIAGDGIVVPVVAVDREKGVVNGYPEIVTRGFVPDRDDDGDGVMREAGRVVVAAVAAASPEERADEAVLKARIQTELRRFLRRRTQRQPLIIPVIVEL
jgi:ribonuclease J